MNSMNKILLGALICISTQAAVRGDVLTGPLTNSVNGHWYYLLSPTNWNAAEAQAVTLGGHLTTVNDAAENAWIFSNFSNFGGQSRGLWLGLNDAAQEGLWVWKDTDGSLYRNWAPGEPNNGGGYYPNEDQAVMRDASVSYPGMWNDAPEDQHHAGVVEIGPPPTPAPMILAGPITNPANSHLYYLLSPTNWPGAEAVAQSLGGHLATISDSAENDWVLNVFANFTHQAGPGLWIGLNDASQEGAFVWVSGDTATYRNWAAGEPNSGGGFYPDEDQAVMRPPGGTGAGQWNDAPGTQHHFAVIETAPPRVIPSQIKVSVVDLCWNTQTNGLYQVQYRTNTTTSPWFNIGGTLQGNGLQMCVPVDMPAGQAGKFFRVMGL